MGGQEKPFCLPSLCEILTQQSTKSVAETTVMQRVRIFISTDSSRLNGSAGICQINLGDRVALPRPWERNMRQLVLQQVSVHSKRLLSLVMLRLVRNTT